MRRRSLWGRPRSRKSAKEFEPSPLAARGRSLIGRVAGAAGPDTRRGGAGDAQASSRGRNKADGSAPPATQRAPGVCRRRTALLVVDDALPSPPRRALPADARSLAHGLSGLLPRAARVGALVIDLLAVATSSTPSHVASRPCHRLRRYRIYEAQCWVLISLS